MGALLVPHVQCDDVPAARDVSLHVGSHARFPDNCISKVSGAECMIRNKLKRLSIMHLNILDSLSDTCHRRLHGGGLRRHEQRAVG